MSIIKITVELVDSLSGDTSTHKEEYSELDDAIWTWTEGNNGCDCCRSLMLWKRQKELPCNSDDNQIKAWLINGADKISLDELEL